MWEKRHKAEMGALAHDRYRHSHGWVSLRDSLELKHIERGMPLPKWTAKKPSTLPQLNRSQWMMGKKKHYHVLNGYYDEDFVTPWRHFALKTHHDINASGEWKKLRFEKFLKIPSKIQNKNRRFSPSSVTKWCKIALNLIVLISIVQSFSAT